MPAISRRQLLARFAGLAPAVVGSQALEGRGGPAFGGDPIPASVLPAGVRATGELNGIRMHALPEFAYSWREVMLPIATPGYHVRQEVRP